MWPELWAASSACIADLHTNDHRTRSKGEGLQLVPRSGFTVVGMETLLNTDACTMPTAERPLRLAEFDALFASAVRSVERHGDDVRIRLAGEDGLVERVRDLTARETSCCSFFTFTIDGTDQDLTLDVSVPPARQEILDALAAASARALGVSLRINDVAQAAGVNRETLRYYERRGLIEQPDRSPGGHRLYDERAVQTLRIIKAAQRLGFTLDEVADLIEVGRRRGRDSGLQVRAASKLLEVEARMADLAAIRDNLRAALDAGCDDLHQCASSDCCPLPFVEITTREADA